ncbi:MAG: hypothetical protein K0S21_542 [Rhizobiaceae bacterium]|jgi:hypothetical protein|nr:hypothetical protein [Rhizobiaceae bacterium]
MTGLCIAGAGKMLWLAVAAFTLSWTHSVERTGWEEDWKITGAALQLVEARIRGSGAGMEPPATARLEGGWWVYSPGLPPQPEVVLAASGATGQGWKICGGGDCVEVGAAAGGPLRLRACRPADFDRSSVTTE